MFQSYVGHYQRLVEFWWNFMGSLMGLTQLGLWNGAHWKIGTSPSRTASYGPLLVINTNKTPFIESIIHYNYPTEITTYT